MGTWGVGSFENDQATDFIQQLEDTGDLSYVDECLGVDPGRQELDVCMGTDVVAAAEVVAALSGRPAPDLPDDLSAWVKQHRQADVSQYRVKAALLLDAVLSTRSELRRLWEGNRELFPAWSERIADLKTRVQG